MKSSVKSPFLATLFLGAAPLIAANEVPPLASGTWLDQAVRSGWGLGPGCSFGATGVTRFEVRENGGSVGPGSVADFRTDVDNDNTLLLEKVLIRAAHEAGWHRWTLEVRHSSSTGDDRSSSGLGEVRVAPDGTVLSARPLGGGSGPESDGPLDLQQAFVRLGDPTASAATVRIGRQELLLGEQRIVGPLAWNNIQRQWDAAVVRWTPGRSVVEAWSSMPVVPDDNAFNRSNPGEVFSGIHWGTPVLPGVWSEVSLLARNVSRKANDGDLALTPAPYRPPEAQDVCTLGVVLRGATNSSLPFEWAAQLYGQAGNFADAREAGGLGPRREHRAWASVLSGGRTWKSAPLRPRVSVEYAFASGDQDPADGVHGTFVHLYPTGHLFYGYADLASLQNLHNVRLHTEWNPSPTLRIQADGHVRWLATTSDGFYNVGGLPRGGMSPQPVADRGHGFGIRPDARGFLGTEVDLVGTGTPVPAVSLEAGWSHVFRGDYIRDSLARVGSQDVDFLYLQTRVRF